MTKVNTVPQRIRELIESGQTGTVLSIATALQADKAQVGRELNRMLETREAFILREEEVPGSTKPVRVFGSAALASETKSIVARALSRRQPLEQAWAQGSAA